MNWIFFFLFFAFVPGPQDEISTPEYTVYFFVSENCPICQYYTKKINEIEEKYPEIEVKLVFPNRTSNDSTVNAFKDKYLLKSAVILDSNHVYVDQFNANVTPETVVYNTWKDSIYYQGRIDDNYARVGKRKAKIQSDDLVNALNAIESGAPVPVVKTDAVGCYITKTKSL